MIFQTSGIQSRSNPIGQNKYGSLGREARVLAGGVAVQAYPGKADRQHAYSFGALVEPKLKFGFRDRQRVEREVFSILDIEGLEERQGGDFAAIPIEWFEEWSSSKT